MPCIVPHTHFSPMWSKKQYIIFALRILKTVIFFYCGVGILVYERIRNLREDKDLTQAEIAQILNISQRTYSRYENDERAIPIEILSALADFHHTSVDYLIGRTDKTKPYPNSRFTK